MRLQSFRVAALLVVFAAGSAGCAYDSSFSFPIDQGDATAGRQAFIDHQCHRCHSVAGVSLPDLAGAPEPLLELGGETALARSYGDLVTSIINPDHAISDAYREQLLRNAEIPLESPMPTPQLDNMTVRQLIDLVVFLDARYQLIDAYSTYD